jgi:hypothetical protein
MPSPRLSLVLVLPLTMTVSTGWAAQSHQSADVDDTEAQSSILFLAIDDFTRPYMRLIFEAFTDAVSTAAKPPAIYFESIDASRFGEPRYLENLLDWLSRKYRD